MRYSANLGFLWAELGLLARIDAAARAGFGAIELHWPYDVPASDVKQRCDRHGLILLSLNTPRGDLSKGEMGLGAVAGRQDEFQAGFDQALDYCVGAGGGFIHCMAGKVPAELREAARQVFVENLRIASAKAARHGLTLLLEPLNPVNVPGYFYSRASEACAIIGETGRDNIKLMFDAYHVGRVGEDPVVRFRDCLPLIGHVQIAAVPSRAEPDEGDIDFRRFLAEVQRTGYAGWIGAEYLPSGDTDAGLGWREKLSPPAA